MRVTNRVKGVTNCHRLIIFFSLALGILAMAPPTAAGGEAPSWMHALVGVTVRPYDEKTDAVLLYSEVNVLVLSQDKTRTQVREAYKILRPEGRDHGTVQVFFNRERRIGVRCKSQSAAHSRSRCRQHCWLRIRSGGASFLAAAYLELPEI